MIKCGDTKIVGKQDERGNFKNGGRKFSNGKVHMEEESDQMRNSKNKEGEK